MTIHANPAIDRLFADEHFAELFKAGKDYDPAFEITLKGNLEGEVRWIALHTMPIRLDDGNWGCAGPWAACSTALILSKPIWLFDRLRAVFYWGAHANHSS